MRVGGLPDVEQDLALHVRRAIGLFIDPKAQLQIDRTITESAQKANRCRAGPRFLLQREPRSLHISRFPDRRCPRRSELWSLLHFRKKAKNELLDAVVAGLGQFMPRELRARPETLWQLRLRISFRK